MSMPNLAEVFSQKMSEEEVKASVVSLRLIEAMERDERPADLRYPQIKCPECEGRYTSFIEPEVLDTGEVTYQCSVCCFEDTYPRCFGLPDTPLCTDEQCWNRYECMVNRLKLPLTDITGRLGPKG